MLEISMLQTVSPDAPGLSRSILRAALGIVLLIIIATAEVTCLNLISIVRVRPDLVLVLVVYFAMQRRLAGSFGCAVVGGLLQDVLGSGLLGINIFSKTMICIVLSLVETLPVTRRFPVRMALMFAAVLLDMTMQYFLLSVAGLHYDMLFYVVYLMIPCAFYSTLVMPLLSLVVERYTLRVERWSPGRE